ncbi:MAG: hypothetical protein Q4D85_13370 [Corynebacterium sp.]|uniref:hypothetical protein n=1 Tax=Corynebacterium sp. TaxID=1720 RepID=UPI0026DB8871|nr:hypothetical protein [Corynebacterium sp.]MDO5099724.1 hypothetical protein [Corynebacterium sp.]
MKSSRIVIAVLITLITLLSSVSLIQYAWELGDQMPGDSEETTAYSTTPVPV